MAEADSSGIVDSVLGSDAGSAGGYGSGLIGGIIDAFTGPVMSNVNYIRSKRVSNRQMGAARWMAQESPSWGVQGLRNAGLNPVLAYTRGFPSTEVPRGFRGDPASAGDLAGSLQKGAATSRQMKLLDANVSYAVELARKAKAEADFATSKSSRSPEFVEAELEAIRAGAEASSASAQQSLGARKVVEQTEKQRGADAASARALEELRGTPIGELLIILREIMGARRGQ